MRSQYRPQCARRKPVDETTRWVRGLLVQPDWVVAASNDLTLDQAARVKAAAADLVGQLGGGR